jgi:uncharacterized membrane protein YbhN (UPF0104 family)
MIARVRRERHARVLLGFVISALFVAATVARVDLRAVGAAFSRVAPAGLALAIVLVGIEVGLRALRWQLLLRPIRPVPYRSSLAYLCIGYFANSLLPARLGDVARAYLAGGAFAIGRVAVLGTILVERLADGGFILVLVGVVGVLSAGGGSLTGTAIGLATIAIVGTIGLISLVSLAHWSGILGTRIGTALSGLGTRLAAGAVALREPRGAATAAALTVVAFALAVASFMVAARALGVGLNPAQAALAMGAVALSTSIPAAPGSLGTYEFVGATVLTSFGVSSELALAIILLVHLVATLPPALAGLIAAWRLHFRVGSVADVPVGGRRAGDAIPAEPT